MGAWGMGSFENDDASDWVYEFESGGASAVVTALEQVCALAPDEYLEAPAASVAIAAAEVVAAARDGDLSNLSESAREALAKHKLSLAGSLPMDRAKASVERILAQSELRDLWEEGEDGALWLDVTAKLLARLRS